MKRKLFFRLTLFLGLSAMLFINLTSCEEEQVNAILEEILDYTSSLGLISLEDTSTIENDINLGIDEEIPDFVDLSSKFPPIGNQGSYGTCVAWAVGYNHRTFLHAVDNPQANLSLARNQMSPKDLFLAIPNNNKGGNCNGTGFEAAFDVIANRGIASLDNVPYNNLGDCSYNEISGTNAADNKIENYRQISVEKDVLKSYLASGRAISIGARLGDNFMTWNNDGIIDYDTYNQPDMQHAYHAMTLCGYDNNKGPNGAFRVVNSWGTTWGDNGYIWVDQDFFVGNTGDFCFAAFVADTGTENPDQDGDGNPDQEVSGMDIVAYELYDADLPDEDNPLVRAIEYNAYNIGNQAIKASEDWNIVYLYYNAYDANEYGIILYDYYSDDFGSYGESGPTADGFEELGSSGNYWNYIDIPANCNVVEALNPGNTYFSWQYIMPEITGEYYLVMITDGFNVLSEPDETNNYAYITYENGDPLHFVDGVIQQNVKGKTSFSSIKNKSLKRTNKNAYSPNEINKLLKYQIESGRMKEKVEQFLSDERHNYQKAIK